VRLSRPRLILRASLLAVAAAFMAWRGWHTQADAARPGLDADAARTLSAIALLEWVLAALAVAVAGVALLALRRPSSRPGLGLGAGTPGRPTTGDSGAGGPDGG
jgi:TRAP-type C4-dicarboxylate transport system permease small subunit